MKKINYENLLRFVVRNKTFNLELKEFYDIEIAFRTLWGKKEGKNLKDSEYKNHVYNFIENEFKNLRINKTISKRKINKCVDLILDYLITIGQREDIKNKFVTYKLMDIYAPSYNLKEIEKDPRIRKMLESYKQFEKDEQLREDNKES